MNYSNLSKDDIRKICNEEYQSPENAILRNWIDKKYYKKSEEFKKLKDLYYSYLDLKQNFITFSEWYLTIFYKPVSKYQINILEEYNNHCKNWNIKNNESIKSIHPPLEPISLTRLFNFFRVVHLDGGGKRGKKKYKKILTCLFTVVVSYKEGEREQSELEFFTRREGKTLKNLRKKCKLAPLYRNGRYKR